MKKNNLEINNPVYISEWNDEKNGSLKPNMIAIGSKRKVWWKCKEGHEWEAAPLVRKNGFGCPYCSGRKPIPGENDFGTLYPQLASEWNDEKNGELTPQMLRPGSGKKAWWKCKEGHEWYATVTGRVHGHNCPICSGNIIIAGKTDLATVNPQLALEWNYEKNVSA